MSTIEHSYWDEERELIEEYNTIVCGQKFSLGDGSRKAINAAYENFPQKDTRIELRSVFEFENTLKIENAAFLICNLNCGSELNKTPNDRDAWEDEKIGETIDNIQNGKLDININVCPRAFEMNYPMAHWAMIHLKLLNVLRPYFNNDSEVWQWVREHYAQREFLYYHTKKSKNVLKIWRKICQDRLKHPFSYTQEQTFKDIEKAMEKQIPIILTRNVRDFIELVPALKSYNNLFLCYCPAGAYISEGDIIKWDIYRRHLRANDPELVRAKADAWRDLTQMITKNLTQPSRNFLKS